jgi:lipoprotein-anchoring transpeptidase ErfK/SrfK
MSKYLIDSRWVRSLQISFVGAVLSLSVTAASSGGVWANSPNQITAQTIKTLQKSNQRWIQIKLAQQKLIAWEGNKPVYAIVVSTGKQSTPTHVGSFKIQSKLASTRMRGNGYDIPNVPHAMFYQGNYGIHGAYWHRRFGARVSRGSVNVAPNHAKWLFNWASVGTPVVVQK